MNNRRIKALWGGIICAILYIQTKCIVLPICLHALVNLSSLFNFRLYTKIFSISFAMEVKSSRMALINMIGSLVILMFVILLLYIVLCRWFEKRREYWESREDETKIEKACSKTIVKYCIPVLLFIAIMYLRLGFIYAHYEAMINEQIVQ